MISSGVTAHLPCVTTSNNPVDWYFLRPEEDASPQPVFANDIILDDRYDVDTSAGKCPGDHGGGAVDAGRVCRGYNLVIGDFQRDDVGLYTCCEHGDDLDDALCTFRVMITGSCPSLTHSHRNILSLSSHHTEAYTTTKR